MKLKNPIVVAFFIQDDYIVVANPCTIPIGMMENAIKEHKERKDKKLATHVFSLMIPIANLKNKKEVKKNGRRRTNTN